MMKSFLRTGMSVAVLLLNGAARAAEGAMVLPAPSDYQQQASLPPYPKDWDKRLGDDFFTRLVHYYALEWRRTEPPPDPTAPSSRRAGWSPAPLTTPPYPFTEWPYGGTTSIGVTRPNSVDSPLMVALSNTEVGKAMNAAHTQVYGWISGGVNLSTNTVSPGGNWPAAYMYTPNTVELDQAVMYVERLPDTVQKEQIDWGFRVAGLYGENYRYTIAYSFASHQLLGHNNVYGYDFPNVYGEVYVPLLADGLVVGFRKFYALPGIASAGA